MLNNNSANEQAPLVSFIVTTYNLPETLLQECLQSITALTLKENEAEIIVIDDGSDESALLSITNFRDRIIYMWQPNRRWLRENGICLSLTRKNSRSRRQRLFMDR